ncbi:hypothetical protein BD779DRAFT_19934 [Infundibulicybe gibba]|nr:hypothetical protein BD779DRAFT_19934 [Infundibulicybe gibba]
MPPMPTVTNSPPESGFVPRKEFIREQKFTPNLFALLAIASSNLVRLYSFPPPLISACRRLLEQQVGLIAFREDVTQNLCEFSLEGRPWSSPKSIAAEKLLLDIFSTLYQCGYIYLSSIDYGRESDDHITIAFSKPSTCVPTSRSGTPQLSTPVPDRSVNHSSERPRSTRTPFALSFASSTLLRVISPPLDSTPAILQAVRGSWPRGVVSEKKVGDNSFEFRLKGYKWFQEDNFAVDSLHYILAILAAFDAHSFTLLTSISLTDRSRVKDLWIFTGPISMSHEDLVLQDSLPSVLASFPDIKRKVHSPDPQRRLATEPASSPPNTAPSQHPRAATDQGPTQNQRAAPNGSSHVLRKPAPRAQVPVSVDTEPEGLRALLPSTISEDAHNMTGVGAYSSEVFYPAAPFASGADTQHPRHVTTPPAVPAPPPMHMRSPHRLASNPSKPISHSPSPSSSPDPIPSLTDQTQDSENMGHGTTTQSSTIVGTPLLDPGVFRDSAFSSNSDLSYETHKWTGLEAISEKAEQLQDNVHPNDHRMSLTPMFPGGWQPTPIDERGEDDANRQQTSPPDNDSDSPTTPLHEVMSRVESPQFKHATLGLRKSEAGSVGVMGSTVPKTPPLPQRGSPRVKEVHHSPSGSGQGWVLVNVEGKNSPTSAELEQSDPFRTTSPFRGNASPPSSPRSKKSGRVEASSSSGLQSSMSPAAKAIVIIDAVDAKNKDKGSSNGAPKRFFSLSRRNSKKSKEPGDDNQHKPRSRSGGFRDKLKHIGTPEAPRHDGKRRSIE